MLDSKNVSFCIQDIGKNMVAVNNVIVSSMERRRFTITDTDNSVLYLVKLVKPKEKQSQGGLDNYVINVYDKNNVLLFTQETNSKKWDLWINKDIERCCCDSIKFLYDLDSSGKLDTMQMNFEKLIDAYAELSINTLKHIHVDNITESNRVLNWFVSPNDELQKEEMKELGKYYNIMGGDRILRERTKSKLSIFGYNTCGIDYEIKNGMYITPCMARMQCTPSLVYEKCIANTIERIKTRIQNVSVSKRADSLMSMTLFNGDWEQLAIERLGGYEKVKIDMILPQVRTAVQAEIDNLYAQAAEIENKISEYKTFLNSGIAMNNIVDTAA